MVSVIPDSPISALFTLRSQLPITVKNISTLVNSLDISHYAKDLNMYDTEMQPETKDTLGKIEQGYVTRYDETVHKIPLKLGDLVLRGTHYSKPGLTKKLLLLFSDTLKIAEIRCPNLVIKPHNQIGNEETVHVNRTKPFKSTKSGNKKVKYGMTNMKRQKVT